MPPKKQRKSEVKVVAPPAPSPSLSPPPVDVTPISEVVDVAVRTWGFDGMTTVRDRLVTYLHDGSTEAVVQVAEAWIAALQSRLGEPQVADLYRACKKLCEGEEVLARLAEGLVQVVDSLGEEKAVKADIRRKRALGQGATPIVVDDDVDAGTKGLTVLKLLLDSSDISPVVASLVLYYDRLVALGLNIPHLDPVAFNRSLIKKSTALFYKQSKYNLLRESSEGFSGLIVLLTSQDALTPSPLDETDQERKVRAARVWSKVMRLIGYFNLSPPRVLDLILEVASCHVATHWRFWLDLLRCSPWGSHADAGVVSKGKGKAKSDWRAEEMAAIEDCMKSEGDRVLGQVLGVKFAFCQKPDVTDTPTGLVYFTALLLKHGFVSLPDILTFLSPTDAEMSSIYTKYASTASLRSGTSNALLTTTLVDDTVPAAAETTTTTGPEVPSGKPPPEQRIQLVQALLAVGHMPAALYFLGRFPWLAQYSPTITDLIVRIVDFGIEGLYAQYTDTWSEAGPDISMDALHHNPPVPTCKVPKRDVTPTLLAPLPPDTPNTHFVFFYPDWQESAERWTSLEELREKGMRWLSLIRGHGGRRVETMIKICRIGAAHFESLKMEKERRLGLTGNQPSRQQIKEVLPTDSEMRPWIELLRISILPCLSASAFTAAFDIEIWQLLRHFPYAVRFGLYGEWRDITCNSAGRLNDPIAARCASDSAFSVKRALARVTAVQSGPGHGGAAGPVDRGPARALAKLSHSNPCALWSTAVAQVKSYSNLGQFIVEAGRYMSQLAMDVATFTLVDTLSVKQVKRLNLQGTGPALWLENLAAFVGDFNRRYTGMDLEPVLQFIINRLMRGESDDLTILQSLISIMSGESNIDNDAISNDQLNCYGAGREMIREAFNATTLSISKPPMSDNSGVQGPQAAPVKVAKSTTKSLQRFISALRDTGLDMPIWIALAQTRQGAADTMIGNPIKAMSSASDKVHDIFIQYGDLLAEQLSASEHIERTPDLKELVSEYHLDFAQAFQILRPKLNAEMERVRAEEKAAMKIKLESAKQSLDDSKAGSASGGSRPATPEGSPKINGMEIDGEDAAEGSEFASAPNTPSTASVPLPQGDGDKDVKKRSKGWWPAALTDTMLQARELLPNEAKEVMSAPFFVIFWHLSMSDISFAGEAYQKSIDKINSLDKEVGTWRTPTTAIGNAQKDERARLRSRVDVLSSERDIQDNIVNTVNRRRLRSESAKWFGDSIKQRNLKTKLSQQLHQYCFYPRALLTPSDAVFVPKLIRLMHDVGTVGFSTLYAYGNFFTPALAASIFSCTENEARNLGRCLAAIMTDLDRWHADEATYQREGMGIIDFENDDVSRKTLPGMMIKVKNQTSESPMTWNVFRSFYYARFHTNLLDALVSCWQQTDFMHVKNAITVALQVLKSFPIVDIQGKGIEGAMEDLINRGTDGKLGSDKKKEVKLTPDVLHQCQAYLRQLKMRQNTKPYIAESKFYPKKPEATPTGPKSSTAASSPRPTTANNDKRSSDRPTTPTTPVPPTPELPGRAKIETGSDVQDALRAKLLENKTAKNAASTVVKEETRHGESSSRGENNSARPAGPTRTSSAAQAPSAFSVKGSASAATNGTAGSAKPAPTGPARGLAGIPGLPMRPGSNSAPTAPSAPSGPAAATVSTSMGPPSASTAEDEKLAARARKFGDVHSRGGTPTRSSTPVPPASGPSAIKTEVKTESSRPVSPALPTSSTSRRSSPGRSRHRSRSIESRASERSRRDRDRGDGDRERESRGGRDRDREREREKDRDSDRKEKDDGRHSRTPSGRSNKDGGGGEEDKEKKKQEDILQQAQNRFSGRDSEVRDRDDEKDKDREGRGSGRERRSSRDRESRRETERERDERKAKERDRDRRGGRESERDRDRERDKERDKKTSTDAAGSKRKRGDEGEVPRRIDLIASTTRRNDDRSESKDDNRRKDDHRDRSDRRDSDRRGGSVDKLEERGAREEGSRREEKVDDRRGDDRFRRRDRDDRESSRDARDAQRDAPPHTINRDAPPHAPSSSRARSSEGSRGRVDAVKGNGDGDLTPKRDPSPKNGSRVELLPPDTSAPDGNRTKLYGDRIVEPPRSTRPETSPSNTATDPDKFRRAGMRLVDPPEATANPSPPLAGVHGLPARPNPNGITPTRPGGPFVPPRAGGGNLMSRMGPAATPPPPTRARSPERQRSRDEPSERERGREPPADRARRDESSHSRRDEGQRGSSRRNEPPTAPAALSTKEEDSAAPGSRRDRDERGDGMEDGAGSDQRKRTLEDPAPTSREGSPGSSNKRVKIDRSKVHVKERGGSRLFNNAAQSAYTDTKRKEL